MRALVVGLGSIGQRHARNLRSLLGEELELAALRSGGRNLVVSDGLASKAGDPAADCDAGVFGDLEAAMAFRPEVVVVANPTSRHAEATAAAVAAGAAVLVEKPVSDRLDGLAELSSLAQQRRAVVALGCQLRFHPALRRAEELLGGGALGRIYHARAVMGEWLPGYHPYEDYRRSYAARADLGGGVVLTQIHEIDYLQWLFGPPGSVFAAGGQVSELELDVEDSVSAVLACSKEGRPLAVSLQLDYLRRPPRRRLEVVGSDGVLEVDLLEPSLRLVDTAGELVVEERFPGFERGSMFLEEMAAFLAAARGERAVEVGLEEGIVALRTALAIRRSLASGGAERP